MSRNSHRSFQGARFRAVLIFMLLIAMTSSYTSLPRPAGATRKTALPRTTSSNEQSAGVTMTNDAKFLTRTHGTDLVRSAAPSQSLPGQLIYQTRPSGYGMNMINPDGTNHINLTDFGAGALDRPSVSETTGMVAFQASDLKITPPMGFQDRRIFVMNGDGTGIKQITFPTNPGSDPRNTADDHPKISPDGTKVAFVSFRTAGQTIKCPNTTNTTTTNREVWVVNVDGSNLQQVTFPKVSVDNGGGCGASDNLEVAWAPNSSQLVVMGVRPYTFTVMPRSPGLFDSLTVVGAGGGQETILALDFPSPLPGQPDEPVTRAVIAPRDGNGVGFLDWSTTGKILFSSTMNNQNGSIGQMTQSGQPTYSLTQDLMGQSGLIWYATYSPDGAHFLISGKSPAMAGDNNTHVFIDGGGGVVPNTGSVADNAVEWAPGSPLSTPNKLTLSPNPIFLYGQTPVRVTPALQDATANTIVRTAQWRIDGAGFRCDNTPDQIPCVGVQLQASNNVDFTGLVNGGNSELQGNLCGINGGVMGCTPYFNTQASAFLSITATNPTAFTSGTGGPGVFTIKREGAPPTAPAIAVTLTVSGTAVRDVDYTLDFTGNTITIPSGQSTVNINVRPLRAQTADKTVFITFQADPLKNYQFSQLYKSSATVTIKNDGASTALSLLRITPNTGGDQGAVQANVYGLNLQQGAIVKLTRSGQADIIGENATVAAGGSSISALFNLIGRAQGAWDVVVTNPNASTATIAGAFTITPTIDPQLWVSIMGRDTIRASHTASSYVIAYGNTGNVDAYGVPLFITGIPSNAEVNVVSTLAQVPGITDPTTSPVISTDDYGQAIPLLLPVVRAGSTNYFRFSLRASQFVNGSFDLSAVIMTPLVKVVAQNNASRGGEIGSRLFAHSKRKSRLTARSAATTPFAISDFLPNPEGIKCLYALGQVALTCGSAIVPFLRAFKDVAQIEKCLAGIINLMGSAAAQVSNYLAGGGDTSPASWTQLGTGTLSTFTGCGSEALKFLPLLGNILNAIGCMAALKDFDDACFQSHQKLAVKTVASADPNEKIGYLGFTGEHYVAGTQPLSYSVFFENIPNATAPAQTVVVTDHLDLTKVDLSTFNLGIINFGEHLVPVPSGAQGYDTDVDLRPGKNLIVRIHAALDSSTGVMTWKFQSIDPATNQPTTDPTAGFLPPDIDGLVGQGSVLFSVLPKAGIADGTQINNSATITFDLNSPLNTNTFTNTIDNSLPASHVGALNSTQPFVVFLVNWSGSDTASGVRDYTVYVSANGGAYTPWIYHTAQTSAYYLGQPSTIYSFYTVATDNANNQEAVKTTAEATTSTRADITNSIDDSRYFVWQHYLDFLARQPDGPGFAHWTGEITMCSDPANRNPGETEAHCVDRKRTNTSGAFYLSNEFQNSANYLIRIYWGSLGPDRAVGRKCIDGQYSSLDAICNPLYSQYITDMATLTQGIVANDALVPSQMTANRISFANQFVGRSNFTAVYGSLSDTQYVDTLAQNTGIALTSQERSDLITQAGASGSSCTGFTGFTSGRACVLYKIVDGTATNSDGSLQFNTRYGQAYYQQEFNPAFVFVQYLGYLRRNPDQGGYDHWLGKLNFYGNFVDAEMVRAFLVSDEYRQRFVPQ